MKNTIEIIKLIFSKDGVIHNSYAIQSLTIILCTFIFPVIQSSQQFKDSKELDLHKRKVELINEIARTYNSTIEINRLKGEYHCISINDNTENTKLYYKQKIQELEEKFITSYNECKINLKLVKVTFDEESVERSITVFDNLSELTSQQFYNITNNRCFEQQDYENKETLTTFAYDKLLESLISQIK